MKLSLGSRRPRPFESMGVGKQSGDKEGTPGGDVSRENKESVNPAMHLRELWMGYERLRAPKSQVIV